MLQSKKMKKVIILAIFFGLLVSGYLFYFYYQSTKVTNLMSESVPEIRLNDSLNVEFADQAQVGDFFAQFGGTSFDNQTIDTTILGEQTVIFSYRNQKNRLRHASFVINVIDTQAPTIMYDRYIMLAGENDDIISKIPCGDNADPQPVCTLSGDYDPDQAGIYQLEVTTQDASNNIGHFPLELEIYEQYPKNEHPPLTFEEMLEQKPIAATLGIDVSKWQADIDWQTVKDAGVDFVMIRLGSQSAFDAQATLDPYFLTNLEGARAAGLRIGVYFYSLAQTKAEAATQADFVLAQFKQQSLDLPIVFDWEAWKYFNNLNLNYYQLNQLADIFLEKITAAGYAGMLYSAKAPLEKSFWQNKNNYPVWLANYVDQSLYASEYQMWQFSSTGEVPGIDNEVDLNLSWI